jgi:two-component system NtrC family sensor kinase
MRFDFPFRKVSLKARLISNYLVILGIGGLVTSVVGSWIVSSTIMMQAQQSVGHSLATARSLYQQQEEGLRRAVALAASGSTIQQCLASNDNRTLEAYLLSLRKEAGFDFLTLVDPNGRVLLSATRPDRPKDDAPAISVIRAALAGQVTAATEILPSEFLRKEDPVLAQRARIRTVPTPLAKTGGETELTSGMALLAAAPVRSSNRAILGALYGGVLLNRNFAIVDRVWELVLKGERFDGKEVGTVTIFQNDVRISTNVMTSGGERAVGTRVSEQVYDRVLGRGEESSGRAFVVNDWYISGYEPIRNLEGKIIGILYVGLLEKAYTSIRDQVILSFFGIATVGFLFIIGITYYEIRSITRPLGEMAAATREIAAGRFDREVHAHSAGEIALLAESFNTMVRSLRQMRSDLEEWGRTLEEKVKQRTEELAAIQARVAQSDRLASLGKLSAGVAHEINNPLGAIMSLTALTLEDLTNEDPNRENLAEVIRQTERCRDIVRGLLEFARQSEVYMEPADLNKILLDTLALVERQSMFFNINVVKDWDPELPPVMADRSQLQQVFTNILMNAVQAMEERGTVTIVTRHLRAERIVEVRITDTGCGISEDKIGRIFDPFFTTKASGQGTGLGLSIAYGIVTSHGGNITAQSEAGKGSTFIIRLPAAALT